MSLMMWVMELGSLNQSESVHCREEGCIGNYIPQDIEILLGIKVTWVTTDQSDREA